MNELAIEANAVACKLLILVVLQARLAALDDFRNWLQLGLSARERA
jgi:hypothetical protein